MTVEIENQRSLLLVHAKRNITHLREATERYGSGFRRETSTGPPDRSRDPRLYLAVE